MNPEYRLDIEESRQILHHLASDFPDIPKLRELIRTDPVWKQYCDEESVYWEQPPLYVMGYILEVVSKRGKYVDFVSRAMLLVPNGNLARFLTPLLMAPTATLEAGQRPVQTRGQRIRAFRMDKLCVTMEVMAQRLGIPIPTLSAVERGEIPCPPNLYEYLSSCGFRPSVAVVLGCEAQVGGVLRALEEMRPQQLWVADRGTVAGMVQMWATMKNVRCIVFPTDWDSHGSAAVSMRNRSMLESHAEIDVCLAFPGGRETVEAISICEGWKIPIIQSKE